MIPNEDTDIERLVQNPEEFSNFVYTPLAEAVGELHSRSKDMVLKNKITTYLGGEIPASLEAGNKGVLFRQVATPNYELRFFLNLVAALDLKPLLLEYTEDIFTPQNPIKYGLGKMRFRSGREGGRGENLKSVTIIDFNESDGKKIKNLQTTWGQSLVDFHHILAQSFCVDISSTIFDASNWFHENGNQAKNYYAKYISWFICHGISFENFILEGDELSFIKEVFLPSFITTWRAIGEKPLIAQLLPTDSENDVFWLSYPQKMMAHLR